MYVSTLANLERLEPLAVQLTRLEAAATTLLDPWTHGKEDPGEESSGRQENAMWVKRDACTSIHVPGGSSCSSWSPEAPSISRGWLLSSAVDASVTAGAPAADASAVDAADPATHARPFCLHAAFAPPVWPLQSSSRCRKVNKSGAPSSTPKMMGTWWVEACKGKILNCQDLRLLFKSGAGSIWEWPAPRQKTNNYRKAEGMQNVWLPIAKPQVRGSQAYAGNRADQEHPLAMI